ncbi:MAG: PD40 domain-containing protein [Bacteroidetes bacterium]|nr:PD40 domain-containing protein [Bacteroidota bacterium]
MKKIFLIAVLLNITTASFSQEVADPKVKKPDYHALFGNAEKFFQDENYPKALELYLQLVEQNQNNANWNYKVGVCYLQSSTEASMAVNYLERAVAKTSVQASPGSFNETKAPVIAYRYLADAYHRSYRFDEAIETYTKFKTYISEKDTKAIADLNHRIEICNNAKELTANPVNLILKNLGQNINTKYPEYSPVISADESMMLFTSRRPRNDSDKVADVDGRYFEDIYISYNTEDSGWMPAKNIGTPINTAGHEATIGISADGQIVFIYKDDDEEGSIYITHLEGDFWTTPEKVGGDVNSPYWESHATLSADGNTLYFVSNRPGGYGGRDIYRCKKLPSGEWSSAINLGPAINTPYDEDACFLHPDGKTLYFASTGHKTMGGFDIFYSHPVDTGKGGWTEPVNIGYPVNTTGDDVFFVPTVDNKRAYYSSFSQDSYGDKDIYMLTFPEKEESKLTVLRGSVVDDFGKTPEGVNITVTNTSNGDAVGNYAPNAKTGKYLLILPHGRTYTFAYEAEGYHTITNTYRLDPGKEYLETEMVFILKDVKMEKQQLGTVGVSGTVIDIQKKIVKSAKINVADNTTGKSIGEYASDNAGKFSFVLQRGNNYNLSFEAEGFLFQTENVNLPKEQVYSSVEKTVVLQPVVAGSKIILNNLFFDFNKSNIRKESNVELDKIVKLLKDKPEIHVEISGHTDNKGNEKQNQKLSQSRASAVMDYLVKKGISKTRLAAKGYGMSQPVASNDTDAGRQLNRRVEMKILGK